MAAHVLIMGMFFYIDSFFCLHAYIYICLLNNLPFLVYYMHSSVTFPWPTICELVFLELLWNRAQSPIQQLHGHFTYQPKTK